MCSWERKNVPYSKNVSQLIPVAGESCNGGKEKDLCHLHSSLDIYCQLIQASPASNDLQANIQSITPSPEFNQ